MTENNMLRKAAGVFGLPSTDINVELNDLSRTNRWFANLRCGIRRHVVETKTHIDAVEFFTEVEERKMRLRDKNLVAAITVVRTAYLSIKLGDSFSI
jgi:hypothetical protein